MSKMRSLRTEVTGFCSEHNYFEDIESLDLKFILESTKQCWTKNNSDRNYTIAFASSYVDTIRTNLVFQVWHSEMIFFKRLLLAGLSTSRYCDADTYTFPSLVYTKRSSQAHYCAPRFIEQRINLLNWQTKLGCERHHFKINCWF